MITEHEINTVKLDPLKKDFYQIWNELLDTAKKISNRWDPTSTNEADPGIVLLKVLTAVADKLFYNIDKGALEVYFPSATQEEAVRKLCDMLGYSMKYYRSATTPVTISYAGNKDNIGTTGNTSQIQIPKYTVITNSDDDISYILTQPITINDKSVLTKQVEAIEGMIEECQVNGDKIITLSNLNDNKRFYFPETQIAENGIFIYNALYGANGSADTEPTEGEAWIQVDNLNTQKINSKVFKFGYDSKEKLPYVQFPEDISNVIEDGVFIKYIRTNGINGNIAARTLNKFQTIDDISVIKNGNEADDLDLENDLVVTNASSTINGANKETIDAAYNNYKRTIGTFDTLVTCRDYMNKIYQMMQKDLAPDVSMDTTPLVSNIIVSDIRDDINNSYVLCTFDSNGINYVDMTNTDDHGDPLISNFDLKLYPFTTISNVTSKSEYDNSFKYSSLNLTNIMDLLKDNKTLSHTYKIPAATDVACIKIYLKLNCKITTNYKITKTEESVILKNIQASLYDAFNMRQLEFGEKIPYDSILDVIKNADTRIKNISLDEPTPYVKFAMVSGDEYDLSMENGKLIYNKLALRNVLAGKIALFNYNENFKTELTETKASNSNYDDVYYGDTTDQIVKLTGDFTLEDVATGHNVLPYTLQDNEVIQFIAPNLRTIQTYPAYVNYYLHLNPIEQDPAPEGYSTKKIEKNADYQLQAGEYLYINYTPASEDGDEAEPENIPYEEGDIIRFNFDVYDSKSWRSGYWRTGSLEPVNTHTYTKTSGYTFNIDGMFSFGAKEQVEIRAISEIQLGSETENLIYVYWQRNNDNDESNTSDTIEFEFKEDPIDPSAQEPVYMSYTLKAGEYFYYTDRNKLNFFSYGSGTKIIRSTANLELVKDKVTEDLTSEDVLLNGLAASIPWVSVAVDAAKYITVKEYQYITLTSGDILKEITFVDDSITDISYTPSEVSYAKYKFMSSSIDSVLPSLVVADTNWKVRSKLDINMGPITQQILHINDTITATYKDTTTKVFAPDGVNDPTLTLKSNYPVVSSSRDTDVTIWKLDEETGTYVDTYSDFKIKVYKTEDLKNTSVLHNFGADFSKLSLSDYSKLSDTLVEQLNILIPQGNTGLIMFYYTLGEYDDTTDKPYTYLTFEGTGNATIFNNIVSGDESWWNGSDYKSGSKDNDKYYLRDGINIIHLPQTITSIQINTEKKNETDSSKYDGANDIIIFGNLDLIETGKELNPKIDYKATSPYAKILDDLNIIDKDHNFYYNTLLDNSSMIDLNENNDDEKLSNPDTWYNYNNVNNKFVITEIDSNYLSTGITIAKSSKL